MTLIKLMMPWMKTSRSKTITDAAIPVENKVSYIRAKSV
jgi:hypothetical protein